MKDLRYPLGDLTPEPGVAHTLADGIGWARLPVPGPLRHVNVWLLDDGDGVAVVDTGLNLPGSRDAWGALLADRRLTRVIATHFHPDHIGCAGWLCDSRGVRLWMNRTEWLMARMLTADVRAEPPPEAVAQLVGAGWSEAQLAPMQARGWGNFAKVVSPLPLAHVRMSEGDIIRIGARMWTVVIGSGHSPEHVCLVDKAGGVMIAGDQVLPRITPNVSVSLSEPEADPLGDWLASIEKLRALPDTLLVLPGHGEPFYGLHARLDRLAEGHGDSLDRLTALLAQAPRRAVDCFGLLFKRAIDDGLLGLATGEALAHLRRLEVTGRAVRENRDGVWWFHAV